MQEIWKDVVILDGKSDKDEYKSIYQVSNKGRVRSLTRTIKYKDGRVICTKGRELELRLNRGYLRVALTKHGKTNSFLVHRLVGFAFLESTYFENATIDHIDTNKTNNNVENLKWCTLKENLNNELSRKHSRESQKGKKFSEEHKNKLREIAKNRIFSQETRKKISEARKGDKNWCARKVLCIETNTEYTCIKYASESTGTNAKGIINCCRGATKTSGGYHWRYI
jgi:hypothetical protein